jgi:predicted GH43/DUF377 family glycosyl hydrolase
MTNEDIVEDRRIYFIDGRYWMTLTTNELNTYMLQAPHLVKVINSEPCSEVTKVPK